MLRTADRLNTLLIGSNVMAYPDGTAPCTRAVIGLPAFAAVIADETDHARVSMYVDRVCVETARMSSVEEALTLALMALERR